MVPTSNGTYRPVGDDRQLNNITKPDSSKYQFLSNEISREYNSFFYQIDLYTAYHRIPLHPDDIFKTTILTKLCLFQYNYMLFGLRKYIKHFSESNVFHDFDSVFVYIDNFLTYSIVKETHFKHFDQVFQKLSDYDLKVYFKVNFHCYPD